MRDTSNVYNTRQKFTRRDEVFVEMLPGHKRRAKVIDIMDDERGLMLQVSLMVDGFPTESDGQPWVCAMYCTLAQTAEEMY
jgi:hypothetical protein